MHRFKNAVKHLLPRWLWQPLLIPFHKLESIVARIRYGFPARSMHFVGITGTNGKSTTVNLMASILEADGRKVGIYSTAIIKVEVEGRDNDLDGGLTTGNPFVLHRVLRDMKKAGIEWVVLEVSSHALVQGRVDGITFEATAITNLTRDHLDYHHTMEAYAAAKGKLSADKPRFMALNRDDDWFDYFNEFAAEHKITYGTHAEAEARITKAVLSFGGSKIQMKLDNQPLDVELKLTGQFNVYNAAAAASLAYSMGLPLLSIKRGLEAFERMPGRMELIDEGQDFKVIIDHAHTEDALKQLFENIRMLLKGRLVTVIGCDGDRDPGKREPIGKLAAEYSELVIVTDLEPYTEDPADIRATVLKGAKSIKEGVVVKENADRRKAIKQAFKFAKKGDVVLIPGLGNQHYRGIGEDKIEWDDRTVARELLTNL